MPTWSDYSTKRLKGSRVYNSQIYCESCGEEIQTLFVFAPGNHLEGPIAYDKTKHRRGCDVCGVSLDNKVVSISSGKSKT